MSEESKVFGRYVIKNFLGSGATSEVFLARDSKLDRQVALKILKPALVSDQNSFERFTREAQAASQLFHDHIATVLDMGEVEGRFYIAMRYVDGVSLDKYLKEHGPLAWEQVKKLADQVGAAISFAHQNQYLHRDIKPNNIMITSKGDFVLTDFGLTRAMHESGMTSTIGAVMGTPPYIPPEVWNGKGATHFSDQYSFACVIDEVITGRMLFAGETPQEIITKHLVNKPVLQGYPREVPENVKYILQKALSKDGKDRFGSVDEFVASLENPKEFNVRAYLSKLEEENRTKADKELLEKLKKKKRRKAWAIAILVMTLLMVVACGVGYLFFRDRIPAQALELFGLAYQRDIASGEPISQVSELSLVSETLDAPTNTEVMAPSPTESIVEEQTPTATPTETRTPTLVPSATLTPTLKATATLIPTPTATLDPKPALILPFEDNFDRGLKPEWRVIGSGEPVFIDGRLTAVSKGEVSVEIGNSNLQKYTLEFDLVTKSYWGPITFYFTPTNALKLYYNYLRWYEFKDNSWNLTSRHDSINQNAFEKIHRLRIVRDGNYYEIFKDGILVHTMKYGDSLGSALIIQIEKSDVSLDNLMITE